MMFEQYGGEGDVFYFSKRMYVKYTIGLYLVALSALILVAYALIAKYELFTETIVIPATAFLTIAIAVYYCHRINAWRSATVSIAKNRIVLYRESHRLFGSNLNKKSIRTEMDIRKATFCATTAKGYEVDGEGMRRIYITKSGAQTTKETTVSKLVIPPYFAKAKENIMKEERML